MSRENIDALRVVYAEWGRGNWQTRFDVYDGEMEWGWSSEFPGLAGVYHDPGQPNERLREWLSPWEHWECEAEEYVAHGVHVVVLARYRGRGKGGGVPIDTEGAHVWKMRNRKAVRLEIFADRSRALQAIGLSG